MQDEKFCGVGDISVLIPYKDFVVLVEASKNIAEFRKQIEECNNQLSALRGLYIEALDKIRELHDMI